MVSKLMETLKLIILIMVKAHQMRQVLLTIFDSCDIHEQTYDEKESALKCLDFN